MTHVAVLGLGAMGRRMAARLVEAGHDVAVWNRSPVAIEGLPTPKGTPREAAQGADIVMSMVTDDDAARAVWLGPDGALTGMSAKTLAVESSTVSPHWIAELGKSASQSGIRLIDAPVAGSRPQAEAGELVFLVGGATEDVDTFRPSADAMGRAVIHAGDLGKGIVLKLMVNALLAVQTAALSELLDFGERNGLPTETAMELLAPIPVTSPAAKVVGTQIASSQHDPLFTIDLLVKDLGYLLDGETNQVMSAVRESFRSAQARGHGDRHISAVAA